MPEMPWDEVTPGWGDDPCPCRRRRCHRAHQRVRRARNALQGDYPGATLDDIDEEKLTARSDEDAVKDLRRLKEIEKALERAGVLSKVDGRLQLTARGARLLGERSLTRLLARVRREPSHPRPGEATRSPPDRHAPGSRGRRNDLRRALRAQRGQRNGVGQAPKLTPDDFEVIETESTAPGRDGSCCSTSLSRCRCRGHWVPAKRMALALHALIEGKYPQDSLYLVGFSDYAREMKPAELAPVGWERVHGTNMEHAFILARRLLGDDPPRRQAGDHGHRR